MNSKIYYGEYTLMHWIDLILKKNLKLPRYQRRFVWDESKALKLLESLNKGQFVPPIIIGAFKDTDENQNYILDGQQRLTSVLLAYLGFFPDRAKFEHADEERTADDNDFNDDSGESDNSIKWTFAKLLSEKNVDTKNTIRKKLEEDKRYSVFDAKIQDLKKFLENTYLGFSYIVPNTEDRIAQQRYYSTVFRNINIMGVKLIGQESRESLYYLNEDLYDLFNPSFAKKIKISKRFTSVAVYMDFVRYISLLSQYYKLKSEGRVGMHYSGKLMESYYEEYIFNVVNDTKNDNFPDFKSIFPDKKYQEQLKKLENSIDQFQLTSVELLSIIDMDVYYFGLIYFVFFMKRGIDVTKKSELLKDLDKQVAKFKYVDKKNKTQNFHIKNPAALKYLRQRMSASIEIYSHYLLP